MHKTARFLQMLDYLDSIGGEITFLRTADSRLVQGAPLDSFDEFTDVDLISYENVLEATLNNPHPLMDMRSAAVEQMAAIAEMQARGIDISKYAKPYCRACGADLEGSDHCPECFSEEFEERDPVVFDRETGELLDKERSSLQGLASKTADDRWKHLNVPGETPDWEPASCPNCGDINSDDDNVCSNCGLPLPDSLKNEPSHWDQSGAPRDKAGKIACNICKEPVEKVADRWAHYNPIDDFTHGASVKEADLKTTCPNCGVRSYSLEDDYCEECDFTYNDSLIAKSAYYDEEAIYQDADIEQAQAIQDSNHIDRQRAKGICMHNSVVGGGHNGQGPLEGGAYYPEQIGLKPGQMRCTEGCGEIFESDEDWHDAREDARYAKTANSYRKCEKCGESKNVHDLNNHSVCSECKGKTATTECDDCDGTGRCPTCGGSGTASEDFVAPEDCSGCGGTGDCRTCGGEG